MKNIILIAILGLAVCTVSAAPAEPSVATNAAVQAAAFPEEQFQLAQIAFDRGEYTEALQHLAQVSLTHSRDSERMPAAVFLEGMIYKKTGQTNAAAYVAEELTLGWPESVWSRRAAELKESKTE